MKKRTERETKLFRGQHIVLTNKQSEVNVYVICQPIEYRLFKIQNSCG